MCDASHQQSTIKLNRSSREQFAILEEAGLDPFYGQGQNLPVERPKF
jgi:hypothetical protein